MACIAISGTYWDRFLLETKKRTIILGDLKKKHRACFLENWPFYDVPNLSEIILRASFAHKRYWPAKPYT